MLTLTSLAVFIYAKAVIASGELNIEVSITKCWAKTQKFLENYRICGLVKGVRWLFWTAAAGELRCENRAILGHLAN